MPVYRTDRDDFISFLGSICEEALTWKVLWCRKRNMRAANRFVPVLFLSLCDFG